MIVLLALLGLFLLIFVIGGYVFVRACVRGKEYPWADEEKLKKTAFGKYYNCIRESVNWLKEHGAKDVYTTSADGLKLHAYWIPALNPRGTVLLAHGYRSTPLVDFGLAFAFYHALGMNILVPSQRAHGKSEGKYITFGVKESDDFACWIHFHNESFGKHQLVLSGLSMGASTVLFLADRDLPENVKCFIADCGFSSPAEILAAVFRSVVHLPARPFLLAADIFARLFAGFSFWEKDTKILLKHSKVPILFVHGLADDFVPCSMSEDSYAACTSIKELFLVKDAGHGVSFLKAKDEYVKRLLWFLEEHLEGF